MTDKKHPEDKARPPEEEAEEGLQTQEDLEKARAEAAGYLDNLQRLQAEFANFRKRMLREQSDFLNLATQEIIKELLPVVDNFERALAHEIEDGHLDDYKGGMQLVYTQLLDALAKEGLTSEEPVGEPFDPSKHEALMRVDTEEYPEGTVVAVLEKGYLLKGRAIRPAKVTVAG